MKRERKLRKYLRRRAHALRLDDRRPAGSPRLLSTSERRAARKKAKA